MKSIQSVFGVFKTNSVEQKKLEHIRLSIESCNVTFAKCLEISLNNNIASFVLQM